MPAFESLVARIRGEYSEMPGLRLTFAQACRFWQMDGPTCETVLEHLVREAFLYKTGNDAYIAVATMTGRQAKAQLRREHLLLPRSA